MLKLIPAAKLEQILMVEHFVRDQSDADIGKAVRTALSSATIEERVNVASRLVALTKILGLPELKPWVSQSGKSHARVNMAVLKAAARAPLVQPQYADELAFDLEAFKAVLAEEGPPQGEA